MINPTVHLSLSIANGGNGRPQHVIALGLVNSRSFTDRWFRFSASTTNFLTTLYIRCVDWYMSSCICQCQCQWHDFFLIPCLRSLDHWHRRQKWSQKALSSAIIAPRLITKTCQRSVVLDRIDHPVKHERRQEIEYPRACLREQKLQPWWEEDKSCSYCCCNAHPTTAPNTWGQKLLVGSSGLQPKLLYLAL